MPFLLSAGTGSQRLVLSLMPSHAATGKQRARFAGKVNQIPELMASPFLLLPVYPFTLASSSCVCVSDETNTVRGMQVGLHVSLRPPHRWQFVPTAAARVVPQGRQRLQDCAHAYECKTSLTSRSVAPLCITTAGVNSAARRRFQTDPARSFTAF